MFNYDHINTLIAKKQNEEKKITIANIAEGIGIALDALNKIKKGRSMPGVDTLEKIAVYFDEDINAFFTTSIKREYKITEPKSLFVNEEQLEYNKDVKVTEKLLDKVFEQQEEIISLKVENERLKNSGAHDLNVHAG